jgi:hypothetical protein
MGNGFAAFHVNAIFQQLVLVAEDKRVERNRGLKEIDRTELK